MLRCCTWAWGGLLLPILSWSAGPAAASYLADPKLEIHDGLERRGSADAEARRWGAVLLARYPELASETPPGHGEG